MFQTALNKLSGLFYGWRMVWLWGLVVMFLAAALLYAALVRPPPRS